MEANDATFQTDPFWAGHVAFSNSLSDAQLGHYKSATPEMLERACGGPVYSHDECMKLNPFEVRSIVEMGHA